MPHHDALPTLETPDAPNSKWVAGITSDQRVGEVAHLVLEARLRAVWHWLPLAAEHSDEDVEYVHQLRIATRRAVQAVRVFARLLPAPEDADLRAQLRRIRLAADAARNWDVLATCFRDADAATEPGIAAHVLSQIEAQRRTAQPAVVAVHRDLAAAEFDQQLDGLLQAVRSQRGGEAKRRFGRQAGRYLKPVLTKFLRAAEGELSQDEALHRLRIRAKKLRYTMEIVAAGFEPAFRRRLYPQITLLQDLLGRVNDHATAKALFTDWLTRAPDAEQRLFLAGVLFAATRAHHDLRQAFRAVWTPTAIARLRRQFRMCCGLP